MGKILKWIGKVKQPAFVEYEVLIDDPAGGAKKEMLLKVNECTQLLDAENNVPVIFLNNMDITKNVLGVVSCSMNHGDFEKDWIDCAYILTTQGMIFMRGIKRWGEAQNAVSGNNLPIWHFQRAADINCIAPPAQIRESARKCMAELKEYCNYVYSSDAKAYEYNAGLVV